MGTLSALDRLRQFEYIPKILRDMDDPPVIVLRRFTVGEKVQYLRDCAKLASRSAEEGGALAGAALSLVGEDLTEAERIEKAQRLAEDLAVSQWDAMIADFEGTQEFYSETLRSHVVEVRELDGWQDEYESALDSLLDLPPIVNELIAVLRDRSVIDAEGDEGK